MSPSRPTVQVIGRRLDPEHHRLRDFLTRVAQPHEWLEARSPETERVAGAVGDGAMAAALVFRRLGELGLAA
jgi:hypothetical protein